MSEANNFTFAQAKTSFLYRPKTKCRITHYTLQSKVVCKRDEKISSLLTLIKLLYGRPRIRAFVSALNEKSLFCFYFGSVTLSFIVRLILKSPFGNE